VFTMGIIGMCSSQIMIEDSADMKKQIDQAIRNGEYMAASEMIAQYMEEGFLSEQDRKAYAFEGERLSRVRASFTAKPEGNSLYLFIFS